MVTVDLLPALIASGVLRRHGMAATVLADRPDITLWPDAHTFARRVGPWTGEFGFIDWYPLVGLGRSRVGESDGALFYGRSY